MLFNGYLLYTIKDDVDAARNTTEMVLETTVEEELSNRGVIFDEFDQEQPIVSLLRSDSSNVLVDNISQLLNQTATIDSNRVLTSQFDTAITLPIEINNTTTHLNSEQFQQIYDSIITDESLFIEGSAYKDFWYLPHQRVIIVRMVDEANLPIVDGSAEIRMQLDEQYQLTGYTQTYQANLTYLPTEERVISERMAIEILDRRVETYIPNEAQLISSQLSYYCSTSLNDINVYSPVWEFIYLEKNNVSKSLLVDAKRGNVLNRSSIVY